MTKSDILEGNMSKIPEPIEMSPEPPEYRRRFMVTAFVAITPPEEKLIRFGRELKWGEAKVEWKAGQPGMVTRVMKDIKLD